MSIYSCRVGHTSHKKVKLHINLDEVKKIPDYPAFKGAFACSFDMEVYDYDLYKDTVGYCTGRDAICASLLAQGIWEGFESLLALDILKQGDRNKAVLDFGANIGWYSMLALYHGYYVRCFEADQANLSTAMDNASLNGFGDRLNGFLCWVDDQYRYSANEDVLLLKTDMEGNDPYAISACEHLFKKGRVEYVLAEISPVLKPGNLFPDMVEKVIGYGYKAYQIPDKGFQYMEQFEDNPLAVVKECCELPTFSRYEYVKSLRQENFLFIKNDC